MKAFQLLKQFGYSNAREVPIENYRDILRPGL